MFQIVSEYSIILIHLRENQYCFSLTNMTEIYDSLFLKTLYLVCVIEKVYKTTGTSGNVPVESQYSSKTSKRVQSRNKNVEEEEKSGEFKNLPTQCTRYVYF